MERFLLVQTTGMTTPTNPYESPQFAAEPVSPFSSVDREKLRRVAKYQQWVIYALLVNIVFNVAAIGLGAG
jgi:hypothetical protein